MENNLDKNLDAFKKALDSLTDEDREKYFPKEEPIPVGWVSIEEHLPMLRICDVIDNNSTYREVKVKDKDGNEYISFVTDHNLWYYMAKYEGITHWYNEEK